MTTAPAKGAPPARGTGPSSGAGPQDGPDPGSDLGPDLGPAMASTVPVTDPAEAPLDEADWYSADTATFGDRVAGAREALGMGQADLAKRLGVKVKTLRDWENDLAEPRANRLQMLAGILGVSLMWLLNGEGDGIDAPTAPGDGTQDQIRDLLLDLRAVQTEIDRGAERLARIEKRLRHMLVQAGRDL